MILIFLPDDKEWRFSWVEWWNWLGLKRAADPLRPGLQSTQQPSTTSTKQSKQNFSFDVSQYRGQVKLALIAKAEQRVKVPTDYFQIKKAE